MSKSLANLLVEKYGMNLSSLHKEALERAIAERMEAISYDSQIAYQHFALSNPEEFQLLVENILISETWFFRDPPIFEYLTEYFKLEWLPKHKHKSMHILCVPSATGEEPYSLAMALLNAGLGDRSFKIDAIDLSRNALEKAKKGVYGPRSFRGNQLHFRSQFFEEENGLYQIHHQVKKRVAFSWGNILLPELKLHNAPYDVILCQNLLIYFHAKAQKRALQLLSQLLADDGILIVAGVETALPRQVGFEPISYPKSHAFKKGQPPVREKENIHTRVKSKSIHKELEGENLFVRASEYANTGEIEKAVDYCHRYLVQFPQSAKGHFLLGLLEHSKGADVKAEKLFSQTLYLNPNHYEALIYMALLLEKQNEKEKAERYRLRAADVIKKKLLDR